MTYSASALSMVNGRYIFGLNIPSTKGDDTNSLWYTLSRSRTAVLTRLLSLSQLTAAYSSSAARPTAHTIAATSAARSTGSATASGEGASTNAWDMTGLNALSMNRTPLSITGRTASGCDCIPAGTVLTV